MPTKKSRVAILKKEILKNPNPKRPSLTTDSPEYKKNAQRFSALADKPKLKPKTYTGNNMTPGYKASSWR